MKFIIVKICTGNSGAKFQKVLTGKSRIAAEFTRLPDAVNVLTWATKAGAERFIADRPTFRTGHEVNGCTVAVTQWH